MLTGNYIWNTRGCQWQAGVVSMKPFSDKGRRLCYWQCHYWYLLDGAVHSFSCGFSNSYSVCSVSNPTFHTIQRLLCEQSNIPYYTAFAVSKIPHSILYSVWCVNNPTFHAIQRLMCQQSHIPYYTAFGVSAIPHPILYSVWCVNSPTFHTIQRLLCEQSNIPYYTAVAVWTNPMPGLLSRAESHNCKPGDNSAAVWDWHV